MQKNNKKLGKRFKDLRYEEDFTQDELAKALGLSKPQISNLENGKREPSITELKAYNEYFKAPMEYLLNISASRNYQYTDISKTLGLNDFAINTMKQWVNTEPHCNLIEVLNYIFETGCSYRFFEDLRRYFFTEAEKFIVYDDMYNQTSINPWDAKISTSQQAFIKSSESTTLRMKSENGSLDERINLQDVEAIFQINLYNTLSKIKEDARKNNLENTINTFKEEGFEDGLTNEEVAKNGKHSSKKK